VAGGVVDVAAVGHHLAGVHVLLEQVEDAHQPGLAPGPARGDSAHQAPDHPRDAQTAPATANPHRGQGVEGRRKSNTRIMASPPSSTPSPEPLRAGRCPLLRLATALLAHTGYSPERWRPCPRRSTTVERHVRSVRPGSGRRVSYGGGGMFWSRRRWWRRSLEMV